MHCRLREGAAISLNLSIAREGIRFLLVESYWIQHLYRLRLYRLRWQHRRKKPCTKETKRSGATLLSRALSSYLGVRCRFNFGRTVRISRHHMRIARANSWLMVHYAHACT